MGSLANKANPGVPSDISIPGWGELVASTVNNLLIGKLNDTGVVTLKIGVSTTVSDARVGPDSVILMMATSPSGAVALDQWSVQTRTDGAFTLTHISTSTSNCTAAYAILG